MNDVGKVPRDAFSYRDDPAVPDFRPVKALLLIHGGG
jgi:hypothetical protein